MLEKYRTLRNNIDKTPVINFSKPDFKTAIKTTEDTKNSINNLVNGKIKSSGVSFSLTY